jgi:NCAIR mutase (PurE)-related protein
MQGRIGILSGGTSDMNVAEEVKLVAETMGCRRWSPTTSGSHGLHRFMEPLLQMLKSGGRRDRRRCGMEGALATVVSSLAMSR